MLRPNHLTTTPTHFSSALKRGRKRRRGAAMLEAAIILPVFILLVFGMIDLGLGVFHYNLLSEAARHGVRQAIVHGEYAPASWNGGKWGPTTIDVAANSSGVPLVDAIAPLLVHCDLSKTQIKAEWLDGNNAVESKVRVTVTSIYEPMFASIIGGAIDLSASSTMPIAH